MSASLQELERWKMDVEKNASTLTKQAQAGQLWCDRRSLGRSAFVKKMGRCGHTLKISTLHST